MGKIGLTLKRVIKLKDLEEKKKEFTNAPQKKKEVRLVSEIPEGYDEHLVTFLDPRSPVAEQYRSLKTHLLSEAESRSINTFLITSSIRGEGKTTTACNLGIVLANNPQNSVLLIDGDMRMPSIHKMFGIKCDQGLVDYLKDNIDLHSLIKPTHMDNLFVLPAGEPYSSPSELLASSKMRELLKNEEVNGKRRYVIIDSPPIIPTTDPRILAKYVGGVILVVQAGRTPKDAINHGLSLLKNAQILGVVLNNISGISPYYPYPYSYAYGYAEYSK